MYWHRFSFVLTALALVAGVAMAEPPPKVIRIGSGAAGGRGQRTLARQTLTLSNAHANARSCRAAPPPAIAVAASKTKKNDGVFLALAPPTQNTKQLCFKAPHSRPSYA